MAIRFDPEQHLKEMIESGEASMLDASMYDWKAHFREEDERKQREREEAERKDLEEKHRVDDMQCPLCESARKQHHQQRGNNGVIGPAYHSWTINEYYICMDCGIHYTDLNRRDKK